jgi:aspartyl-tRNA(Asn)/glutamyl-tRNA(Gln) amidotransferase subunit A
MKGTAHRRLGCLLETIQSVRARLATGAASSRALVEECLARASAAEGEGGLVFTRLDPERARRTADGLDALRAAGVDLSPICGIPISIKDLFDVEGEVTTAGSAALRARPAAQADAPVVARLKCAGVVIVGRTNMTEFAFSGVGLNPHYGTPANPYDRKRRRIPGGSSSGAAVSVTDGMALAAIGTDTGGSVRIPAALCGLVGFKPTQNRIPLDGVSPLSQTLDSVGTIAPTVACCAAVDAVLAGDTPSELLPADSHSKVLAVPTNYFLDDLDGHVAGAFESALSQLRQAGARLVEAAVPEIADIAAVNAKGGFNAAESYAFHRRLGTDFAAYDPLVRERIERGQAISAADYRDMVEARSSIIRAFDRAHAAFDAIVCPTVPIIAPEIAAVQGDAGEFRRVNLLLLRNTPVANFLDRCSLSVPCHQPGEAPVGLMLIGRRLGDKGLLSLGLAVEQALAPSN